MKTANELALEYWNKSPMERMHSTLQNFVYDYMSSQNERLRTQAIADAEEIARLQSGFDELRKFLESKIENNLQYGAEEYSQYKKALKELNRITGDIEK